MVANIINIAARFAVKLHAVMEGTLRQDVLAVRNHMPGLANYGPMSARRISNAGLTSL